MTPGIESQTFDSQVLPERRSGRRFTGALRWPLLIVGRGLVVLGIVIMITFLLVRVLPGDPVTALSGPHATQETRDAIRTQLGLDGSLLHQFIEYIRALARGDLGASVSQGGVSVASIIGHALPVTLALVVGAIVVSILVGVPLGLIAGYSVGAADAATRSLLTVMLTLPPFFFGLLLIWGFSLTVPWFPAGGWEGWGAAPRYLVLPVLALSISLIPLVARATRQASKESIGELWVEAAETRGLAKRRMAIHHILPNSILPVVTLVGYNAGVLVSGAVVVEAVFSLPGIGQELVGAVSQRDYPVVQGIALVCAVAVVIFNALTDIAYVWIDPRVRRA